MTIPAAALPGQGRGHAINIHKPHPGEEARAGCPNCEAVDQIVITVPTEIKHRINAWAITGVTDAEIEITASDSIDPDAPLGQVTKIQCLNCKWAVSNVAHPLSLLVAVNA